MGFLTKWLRPLHPLLCELPDAIPISACDETGLRRCYAISKTCLTCGRPLTVREKRDAVLRRRTRFLERPLL